MTFANPGYLFLLLLLIPIIVWYAYELRKSDASLQISDTRTLAAQPKSMRIWLLHVPFVLRVAVVSLLSIALARPQLTNRWSSESTEGIDIMFSDVEVKPVPINDYREYMKERKKEAKDKAKSGKRK